MKELSPEMQGLLAQKNMPKDSPILVRIFKEESELEVWKQDTNGQFQILKIYPICRWSGELGPKKVQGDRQAPPRAQPCDTIMTSTKLWDKILFGWIAGTNVVRLNPAPNLSLGRIVWQAAVAKASIGSSTWWA